LKAVKKILVYFFLSVVVLVITFGVSVYFFKDKIIQQFIREANKSLSTPVQIGRIEVSAWQAFPNVAITFTDVYVEDSHLGLYPLLTAKTVSFSLNAMDALQGKYSIRGLRIVDSETHLKINETGLNNFTILKESGKSNENIYFDLHNVRLVNTKVTFQDLKNLLHHNFESEKLTASVKLIDDQYQISASGDIAVGKIGIHNLLLLPGKKFDIDADIVYDDGKKNITVNKSTLTLGHSEFAVIGDYQFKEKDNINVSIKGTNTDIQTVFSLFPEESIKRWNQYQSKGEIYFSLTLKGEISSSHSPFVSVSFGC
jgi:uncharacterized protein involved in outer membrane biogenesis